MIRGRDEYYNLSHQGAASQVPPVRFGDIVVPASVAWVLAPIGKNPSVRAEFEMRAGKPVCTLLTIQATDGGRPIHTADLDALPGLDRKGVEAFKVFATRVLDDEEWRQGRNLGKRDWMPSRATATKALRGRPMEELERVAQAYRENLDNNPVEAVEALGYARRTAARRVQQARSAGLLPPTTQGRKKA